jgi:1-acyl-sn-glycerol-3-phosphate acyltransferase
VDSLIRRLARRTLRVIGVTALTAGHGAGYALASRIGTGDTEALRQRWVRSWSQSLLTLFAIDVRVIGTLPASGATGLLVVSNHRSPADILVLLNTFAGYILSRDDLARWPIIGPAASSIGTVYVDRGDNASGASAVQAIQKLLAARHDVILFPEATIFEGDEVRPFKHGSFAAARRLDARVLPVGIAYESGATAAEVDLPFLTHVARTADAPHTRVVMHVGAPIESSGFADTEDLVAASRESVQQLVHAARREVDHR